ncbi:MAG: pyridoxamine 5'-phosphate oxidase [Pseudomonadota bacterium]
MAKQNDLRNVRRDYESMGITKSDLAEDPFAQFDAWLKEAIDADVFDATAMTLATADSGGVPSARVVLLKHFDENGFCWYTDSRSQKGTDLAQNPSAALLFYWREFSRQIRIVGEVSPLSPTAADEYFYQRPEGSRFSAASSHQTSEIDNRAALETRVKELMTQYPDGSVPRPDAWIGYCLKPREFEFWQGKSNRLHDRIIYLPTERAWRKTRRSP